MLVGTAQAAIPVSNAKAGREFLIVIVPIRDPPARVERGSLGCLTKGFRNPQWVAEKIIAFEDECRRRGTRYGA